MKAKRFNEVATYRMEQCSDLLIPKGEEYSRAGDRLHNFKRAARALGQTPEQALIGMYAKHMVSVLDMIDDAAEGKYPKMEKIAEKIGDSINYHLLLEGLFVERMDVGDRCFGCGVNFADEKHLPSCVYRA